MAAAGLLGSQTDTLEALADLVDHGLVIAESDADFEARFRMHDAIRDFAQSVASSSAEARDRMLEYYVEFAEQAEPELERREAARWSRLLAREVENLRGALAWAYKSGAADRLLRLATALGNFWRWHGYVIVLGAPARHW